MPVKVETMPPLPGLSPVAGKAIIARFDGGQISSDAGVLVLREVEQRKATWLYLVPAMMSRIWRLPEEVRARYDLSSLETVWHLAAPCPPWLKEVWIDWVGGEVLMELYAGTEAQAGTIISGTEWLGHRGSVGEVVGSSPAMMTGYNNRPDATPAMHWYDAEGNLFYRHGDIGRIDVERGIAYLDPR